MKRSSDSSLAARAQPKAVRPLSICAIQLSKSREAHALFRRVIDKLWEMQDGVVRTEKVEHINNAPAIANRQLIEKAGDVIYQLDKIVEVLELCNVYEEDQLIKD